MYITAGRTLKSRYDARVPVHIAVQTSPDAVPLTICGDKEAAQVSGVQVSVTCSRCLSLVHLVPDMCRIATDLDAGADEYSLQAV